MHHNLVYHADMLANDKGKAKEDVTSWTGYPGGAPCNVACGLGKLGIPVAFVSSLGNDGKGDELLHLMNSTRVTFTVLVNTFFERVHMAFAVSGLTGASLHLKRTYLLTATLA